MFPFPLLSIARTPIEKALQEKQIFSIRGPLVALFRVAGSSLSCATKYTFFLQVKQKSKNTLFIFYFFKVGDVNGSNSSFQFPLGRVLR